MLAFANLHRFPGRRARWKSRTGGAGLKPLNLVHRRAPVRHPQVFGEFTLRRLDPDGDLPMMHCWMNDPEVAQFWKMAWPLAQIEQYLRGQHGSAHSVPYVGEIDGTPMSYWELYRADRDPLAQYYPARDHDAGVHLLLGPAAFRGLGLAAPLLTVVSAWLLESDPRAARVVAEPDVENTRSISAFERAGFRRVADVDLPKKRAALMVRERCGDPRSRATDYVSLR